LLALLSLIKNNKIELKDKIHAYDKNYTLINVYKNIQNHKDELYKNIQLYISQYDKCDGNSKNKKPNTLDEATKSKESYYYWIRKKFNQMQKDTIECSSLFIILNKLCFRGLYRESVNGFNVPFGHYKQTPNITFKKIEHISDLIKDVEFKCCDFNESIKDINDGDFVYCDPPYVPENEKSFVGYTSHGFSLDDHKKLFELLQSLNNKNIKFGLSNSKTKLVLDNFKNYNIQEIICRRAINSKKPESKTTEVIITN